MFSLLIFLVVGGCVQLDSQPLPFLRMPKNARVLRESFQGPGPERTGNWRGWFDKQGCWWEEHNTWLVVSDPALMRSQAHPLHWNAVTPSEPWFCLRDHQRRMLADAIERIPDTRVDTPYTKPVDRWTIQDEKGHVRSAVIRRGSRGGDWAPMVSVFRQLAAMSVWGQSPESS